MSSRPSAVFRITHFRLVTLLFLLTPLAASAQMPPPPQVPPPNWTRSHDYDVQHYRINVSFDWQKKMVTGDVTITLRPFPNNFKEVELDAGEMTIKSVTLAGGKALQYKYEDNEKLRVTLDRPYVAGQDITFNVAYSAVPKKGLVFITPTEDDPSRPYQIWNGGETEMNHYWFPCYDYPNDFATTEMNVTVEDKYTVISNGALVKVDRDPKLKTATYRWKMEQPHATYLTSIVVGEYAEIKGSYDGIPVSSWVYKDKVEDGKVSFGKLPEMVKFFSEKTGVRYPYEKYAQVMVRDFPGALENISATTMFDNAVYDKRALLDQSSDGIVSHELAHQWFGDLVTCRDWSEIWLNESFATYFAHLFDEADKGRDELLYGVLQDQRQYFNAWNSGNRQPIVNNRYDDPDSVFSVYAYPRGGATLHMLRTMLGDEAWWKAINHYLKTNRGKNVETAQLKIAIEEATGQNLGWFFDQWVLKMGHPELEVSYTYDDSARAVKLKVKQTQKAPEKAIHPVADLFRLPTEIAIVTAKGERVEHVTIDKAEQDFTFTVDSRPLIVNFDRGNAIIKKLKFDKPKEELIYQAQHDPDVMGRIWAVNELKKLKEDDVAKALGDVMTRDAFYGVKIEAAKALANFQTEAAKTALLGGAKDTKSVVRREAIKALAQFKDQDLADLFISIVSKDESYYAIADAARALGATGSPKAFDALAKAVEVPSDKDVIRAGALEGMAALKDKRALDLAFKCGFGPNSENVRAAALKLALAVGKDDEAAKEKVLQLLIAALKSSSLGLKFNALGGINQLGDPRALPAVEALEKEGFASAGPAAGFLRQFTQATIKKLKGVAGNKP
ncbi:MAG TPA: DUF3458 domain-containing protein [Blastocatellia bacterium]|nr:DUF3458 domain-containing protein [Blastocatellia bacterium]